MIAIVITLITVFQERITFQPQGPPYPEPANALRVSYSATDGQQLIGYVIGSPAKGSKLLIAFHGNADMAALQLDWAEQVFKRTGVPVLVAEYRGYAGLAGKPTYRASQLDAEAAHLFATQKLGVLPHDIALFGHSLGSAIAAELAARATPAALILESPFTSAKEMARTIIRYTPSDFTWKLVSRIHFNTLEVVKHLDCPVSVAHGRFDRLIPPEMGRAVYEAARKKGEWLLVANASHNDVSVRGAEQYWNWIANSLQPLVNSRSVG